MVAIPGLVAGGFMPSTKYQPTRTPNPAFKFDCTEKTTSVNTHTTNHKGAPLPYRNIVLQNGGDEWKETQTYQVQEHSYEVQKVRIT
jgi:hypothetical protein